MNVFKTWHAILFIELLALLMLVFINTHIPVYEVHAESIEPIPIELTCVEEPTPYYELTEEEATPYYELTEEERRVVENIVMGEAGAEPYEGQMLVAQCILNACERDNLLPSEVRMEYKYSGWNENPNDSVKLAVKEVFDNGVKAIDEPILYFYAPAICNSSWHERQVFVVEVGGHRFFKEV